MVVLSLVFGTLSPAFLGVFAYYSRQRSLDVEHEFLRGVSSISKPVNPKP